MDRAFFHTAFVVEFLVFTVVRAVYHKKASRSRGKVEFKEGKLHRALRLIVGVPFMLALVGYMLRPTLLEWGEFPLPVWLQWVGFVMGLISIPLIWWVQWALGSNFSTTLHVREEHTLVIHGPYRWVRHPMYTVLYMHLIAVLLLTKNWFIGGVFLASQTLIVLTRLKNEEAVMIEKFGDEYLEYMKRTGCFFPRLKRESEKATPDEPMSHEPSPTHEEEQT